MGFLDLFKIFLFGVVMVVTYLHWAESGVAVRFTRVPPVRSRFPTAVFGYVVERTDGRKACDNSSCSITCKHIGRVILPCPMNVLELKNSTENREHSLCLGVTTGKGENNSTAFSCFIDTIPPTATISGNQNYTNAETVTVQVAFWEPCNGNSGFNCTNSSHYHVKIHGLATMVPSSLRSVEDENNFTFDVSIPQDTSQGRVIIRIADCFCTDEAGNEQFMHVSDFGEEPAREDLWALVPSYVPAINGVLRGVYATNTLDGVEV